MTAYHLIGALGLVFISLGVLLRRRCRQDLFFIFGGICLLIYSIYLGDVIFMILQAVFILSAVYDAFARKRC